MGVAPDMKFLAWAVATSVLLGGVAEGQVVTTNPLDDMKAKVVRVLEEAGQPFSENQEQELALVIEEQRRASERLFGDIMDFSGGAIRGADRDRAHAGINWMTEAFEAKLVSMLTPEQHRIWTTFSKAEVRLGGGLPALRLILVEASQPLNADQEARGTAIFARAAERLQRVEAGDTEAGEIPAIVDEALTEVTEVLTAPQADAVVAAARPVDAGSASGAAEQTRLSVVQSLAAVARPTATFVGSVDSVVVSTASSVQISQIRINNNSYTAENFGGRGGFGFGGGGPQRGPQRGPGGGGPGRGGRGGGESNIEVIQRGGVGDYHGNFSFDFRDEALTATNAFAGNKPEFQQRNINANISGPFIRNVLTASLTFNQNEQENADTVVATTPTGELSFGIVRPAVNRSYSGSGQMQLGAKHALHFNARYSNRNSQNNGVGGFTLPERAWQSRGSDSNFGLREIWALSPRLIHEVILNTNRNSNEDESSSQAVSIDVLDAFNSGGSGQDGRRSGRNYTLTNMLWYEGDRLTFKVGSEITSRLSESLSREGFQGQFTFSSLADFVAGRPLTYEITRGTPDLEVRQRETGFYVQTDWRVNRRFTFFAGLRYEWQSTVDDFDNLNPRVAFAYSLGSSTIVRGGVGLFHMNLNLNTYEEVLRLDGARQYQVVVSEPAYPDPFSGGTATVVPPASRRVLAPGLEIPYETRASLSVERTLRWNIAFDGAYEFTRGDDRYVSRNINAPRPDSTRPYPNEGNILQLEATARSQSHNLRLGIRQRLSFLTYNAGWTWASDRNDSEFPFYQPMNSYDPRVDWGRAGFTARHRYNFTVNAQAPFGTLVTVAGSGHSGQPYNITTGKDDNDDQNTNDRPAGVARNSGTGPRFFNVDATLSKNFRLGGGSGQQLSVYAKMANAFNLINLRNPSGVMTSKYFGIPTSAADARDVEVGIRYQF